MLSGPFSPGSRDGSERPDSTLYAFFADDCELHFEKSLFTAKQREDHEANIVLTAMLQVALIYMGRREDYVALHKAFTAPPWAQVLATYQNLFENIVGDVIPPDHRLFAPRENFYAHLAEQPLPGDRLGLYMTSGSNLVLHRDRAAWQRSANLNSKMHFAANAADANIPTPKTQVLKKADLAKTGAEFIAAQPDGAMIKVQGLAGARNVGKVADIEAALAFVEEYDDDLDVLLQERLDPAQWREMTLDLSISEETIEITNVRRILFADGLWVGNYISDQIILAEEHRSACLAVGRYVQAMGYHAPGGLNCGIDFFVRGDDIRIIEINARWTGGLFPAQLLKRLQATSEHSTAFIDMLSPSRLDDYLQFLETHAPKSSQRSHGFRIVPMGFSPFIQKLDSSDKIYVWQVVIGDFDAFRQAKQRALGNAELPTADMIDIADTI